MRDRELAAAYVLGELEPEARVEFERRLGAEPALQAEVEVLRPLAARLAELPAEAWPQPGAPAAPETAPARPRPHPLRRRWSVRPALALAALLAVLLVGGGAGALLAGEEGGGNAPPPPQLTLDGLGADPGAAGLVSMPSAGEMRLRVDGLRPNRAGEFYELWLLGEDGETVPVASFRVGEGGAATLRVPLPVDPGGYRYFDVSRQEAAAGTEHSSDSVLRGPTSPS